MDWKICLMSSVFMIEMTVLMFSVGKGSPFGQSFQHLQFLGQSAEVFGQFGSWLPQLRASQISGIKASDLG